MSVLIKNQGTNAVIYNDKRFQELADGSISGSIVFSERNTRIKNYLFKGTRISSVQFPSTVTEIGDFAFANCTSLLNINLNGAEATPGKGCFSYLPSLTSFSGMENLKIIPDDFIKTDGGLLPMQGTPIWHFKKVTKIGGWSFNKLLRAAGSPYITFIFDQALTSLGNFSFEYNNTGFIWLKGEGAYSSSLMAYASMTKLRIDKITVLTGSPVPSIFIINTPNIVIPFTRNSSTTSVVYVPLELISDYKNDSRYISMAERIYPAIYSEDEMNQLDVTIYTKCYRNDLNRQFFYTDNQWMEQTY